MHCQLDEASTGPWLQQQPGPTADTRCRRAAAAAFGHILTIPAAVPQRFWVLETVARIPYFSYISMLHLYESLGWWRAGAELRKVHFAEEWNELHHLQVCPHSGPPHALPTGDRSCCTAAASGTRHQLFGPLVRSDSLVPNRQSASVRRRPCCPRYSDDSGR
jgi:hypothetical protein